MISRYLALPLACLVAAWSMVGAAVGKNEARLSDDESAALHALIKPQDGEARWAAVPWMPATDIWAARRKAAEEDKPVLLWYMAGEPLGTC